MPDLVATPVLRDTALHETPGVRLESRPGVGKLLLRCHRARAPEAAAWVKAVTGWELPLFPNAVLAGEMGRALWLEPGAWMLIGEGGQLTGVLAAIEEQAEAPAAPVLLATDASSGRCIIEISGPDARALIESGCPVDLHPSRFGPGRCAASLFNETAILIDQVSAQPVYALICERPSAAAVWRELVDAAELLG